MAKSKDFKAAAEKAAAAGKVNTAATLINEPKKKENRKMLNLAMDPDTYDFIKITARVSGESMNKLINKILSEYADEHAEVYTAAKKLIESL